MMGREDARNMWSFITEQIWIISASGRVFEKKSITMQVNTNVKPEIHLRSCLSIGPTYLLTLYYK